MSKNMGGIHIHLDNKVVSKRFFWIMWIMYAVVYMTKNCYSAAMASIVYEGVLTKSETGFITSAFYFVYAPLQILGGYFSDRYEPRKMIQIGLIGSAVSNLVIYCNQNYYVMLSAWVFNAITQFALWPALFKIISSQLESEYRVKGVYLITFASTVGLLMAYIVAAIVPKWQYNFAISSICLFLFAVIFYWACKWAGKYMVPNERGSNENKNGKTGNVEEPKMSTWKLFLYSGFFLMVVVTALRTIVENGIKTLSSTMLMESYKHVSPSIGNILNTFIIIAGVLGLVLVNQIVYPRLIKNEATATLVLLTITLIPITIMTFLGRVSVLLIVVSLCVSAAILTGTNLLMSCCSAAFLRYGKNGMASGVSNAAASVAIMLQSYGVVYVADHAGWKQVVLLYFALLMVSAFCAAVAMRLWKNFKIKKRK